MSGSVNKVILIGRLGKDPEMKGSEDRRVCTMSIATSDSWKDKETGERKEQTEWHRIVIFNKPLIEFAEKYLKKGMNIYIEGQNATRKWTDKDGIDRYMTEVVLKPYRGVLQSLQKIEGGGHREDGYGAKPADNFDDEIPF